MTERAKCWAGLLDAWRQSGLTQLSHDEEIFEPRTAVAGAPGRFSVRFRV